MTWRGWLLIGSAGVSAALIYAAIGALVLAAGCASPAVPDPAPAVFGASVPLNDLGTLLHCARDKADPACPR